MFMHNRVPDFAPGRMSASANARGECFTVAAGADGGYAHALNLLLHVRNNLFRLMIPPVNHQPARTLRNPAAKENHHLSQRCADSECQAPSEPDWNVARIEQHERSTRAHRGADPV